MLSSTLTGTGELSEDKMKFKVNVGECNAKKNQRKCKVAIIGKTSDRRNNKVIILADVNKRMPKGAEGTRKCLS